VPLPVILDTYRIAQHWLASGQIAVNVWHVRRNSSTAAAIATIVDANVTAAMWGCVWNGAAVSYIEVTPLDGGSATYRLNTSGAKWTGSAAASDPVINAPALIKLQTTQRGPRNRGRLFLPFTAEVAMQGGALVAGTVTSMQTAWTNWLNAMTTAGAPVVVASYRGGVANNAVSATVETILATMRKRQSRLRV
jgi:hypothetical protein